MPAVRRATRDVVVARPPSEADALLTTAIAELPFTDQQKTKLGDAVDIDLTEPAAVEGAAADALQWFRWTTRAAGRMTQTFADGLTAPVAEAVAGATFPASETADEAEEAMLAAARHVLGGSNVLGPVGDNAQNDEEWRAIRSL